MNNWQTNEPEEMTLLVLERGAPWPSWAASLRSRADHSAVEVQTEGESPSAFAARIEARIARLIQKSIRLIAAGYVCAPSPTSRATSRRGTCEGLLGCLDPERQPELMIGAGDWDAGSSERAELIELWGVLSHSRPGISVSVCFDQEEKNSGVFRAAPLSTKSADLGSRPSQVRSAKPSQVRSAKPSSTRSSRSSSFATHTVVFGPLSKAESAG